MNLFDRLGGLWKIGRLSQYQAYNVSGLGSICKSHGLCKIGRLSVSLSLSLPLPWQSEGSIYIRQEKGKIKSELKKLVEPRINKIHGTSVQKITHLICKSVWKADRENAPNMHIKKKSAELGVINIILLYISKF